MHVHASSLVKAWNTIFPPRFCRSPSVIWDEMMNLSVVVGKWTPCCDKQSCSQWRNTLTRGPWTNYIKGPMPHFELRIYILYFCIYYISDFDNLNWKFTSSIHGFRIIWHWAPNTNQCNHPTWLNVIRAWSTFTKYQLQSAIECWHLTLEILKYTKNS